MVVNIQAVLVEKASKRRLMSGMHALWSVGGFVGTGLFGVWVGTLGLTPFVSTCIAAGIMLLILAFLPAICCLLAVKVAEPWWLYPSLYATFGLLAFLVALQALIAAYVYKKVL